MTGIALVAAVGADAPPRARLGGAAARMAEAMAHRGSRDGLALHDRFGLVPLGSRAARRGPLHLALDGTLLDRRALADALGRGVGLDDAELLLAGWEAWGARVVDRADGEFAAAIVDERDGSVVLLRDAVGTKPLYYARADDVVLVASEVQGLFAPSFLPAPELDPFEAARFAASAYAEEDSTLFAGVRAAQAGGATWLGPDGERRLRVWAPDPFATAARTDPVSCGEAFRAALTRAVRLRLPEAGPAAVLVSGGFDSSSVACLTADLAKRRGSAVPPLLHLAFPGSPSDEGHYFTDVATRTGARCVVVDPRTLPAVSAPGARNGPGEIYEATNLGLEPLFDAAALPAGTVLLNGYGGDDLLATTGLECVDAMRAGDLVGALRASHVSLRPPGRGRGHHLVLQALRAFAPDLSRRLRAWRPAPSPWSTWITQPWRDRLDVWNRDRIARRERFPAPGDVQRRLAMSIMGDSDLFLFLSRLDRMAARRGLDLRLPYYDRGVIDALMATPWPLRANERELKGVVREGMRGILPESVRTRQNYKSLSPWQREMVAGAHREAFRACLTDTEIERIGVAEAGAPWRLLNGEDPSGFVEALDLVGLEEAIRTLRVAHATDSRAPEPRVAVAPGSKPGHANQT